MSFRRSEEPIASPPLVRMHVIVHATDPAARDPPPAMIAANIVEAAKANSTFERCDVQFVPARYARAAREGAMREFLNPLRRTRVPGAKSSDDFSQFRRTLRRTSCHGIGLQPAAELTCFGITLI